MPAPCGVPLSVSCHSSLSRMPASQPLADQPQDARIGDPVRHHPQQPLVVDRVEEAADVGIEHPVHALAHHRRMQRRESLMRVPSRPEAVGEAEEVDLVDGAQHLGDRALDDLVLQRRHAERALPAIGFRDVDAPNRLRPVAPACGRACRDPGGWPPGPARTPPPSSRRLPHLPAASVAGTPVRAPRRRHGAAGP